MRRSSIVLIATLVSCCNPLSWPASTDTQQYRINEVTLTNIPPNPVSVHVRLTDPLAPGQKEIQVSVSALPSNESLPSGKVALAPLQRRVLDIPLTKPIPNSATNILVCFRSLTFLDQANEPFPKNDVCAVGDILTSQNIEDRLKRARQTLFGGQVESASDRAKQNIKVAHAILDPGTVSDAFGGRIANRYLVVQVTVANSDPDYQFLIEDISLQIESNSQSSVELSILRGTAERGQLNDPRNIADRSIKGAGSIAAGLSAVAKFGRSFAPSVALFNGPMTAAFESIFPDYTINQMNRLNDRAYSANKVIPVRQAVVIAVFVPMQQLLSASEIKTFHKDPHDLLTCLGGGTAKSPNGSAKPGDSNNPQPCASGKLSAILVKGDLITSISDLTPSIIDIVFGSNVTDFQKDSAKVKGYVLGQNLTDATIALGANTPAGMTISVDGTPTATQLNFEIATTAPVAPGTPLEFVITKGKNSVKVPRPVPYQAATPTLTKLNPPTGKGGTKVPVTATGTNFLPGMTVTVSGQGCDGIVPADVTLDKKSPSTTATFNLQIPNTAKSGTTCNVAVVVDRLTSNQQPFKLTQ